MNELPQLSSTESPDAAPQGDAAWQQRLLPLMVSMLVGITIFFLAATCVQLVFLHRAILRNTQIDLKESLHWEAMTRNESEDTQHALLLLEQNSQAHHYHQANVLLMSRVWTQYLGFVTGMILSLIGAIFILGKLREPPYRLGGQVQGGNFSLETASPGLGLAVLGVVLMVTTLLVHHEISEQDQPVYFRPTVHGKADPAVKPELVTPGRDIPANEAP